MSKNKCVHSYAYIGVIITIGTHQMYRHECTECGQAAILDSKQNDYLMINKIQLKKALDRQPSNGSLDSLWALLKGV
jgi:hypothetical protein